MRWIAVPIAAGLCGLALAQLPLDPAGFSQAAAVLAAHDPNERSLACQVRQVKPQLNFVFRFQAGYSVGVPLTPDAAVANIFAVLVRVTPANPAGPPQYFTQAVRLRKAPPERERAKPSLEIDGGYLLGEGVYDADLLVLDGSDRACRKHWRIDVRRSRGDRQVPLSLEPG